MKLTSILAALIIASGATASAAVLFSKPIQTGQSTLETIHNLEAKTSPMMTMQRPI